MIRDQFESTSNYKYFSNIIYNASQKLYKIGISFFPPLKKNANDTFYYVPAEESYRPDKISQKFYGTPHLDWVICLANSIEDPLKGFYTNRFIIIPDIDYIFTDYLKTLEGLVNA